MENLVSLSVDDVYTVMHSGPKGLDADEAAMRHRIYGANVIQAKAPAHTSFRFLKQLKDWFSLLLIIAAILSWVAGTHGTALFIIIIVFVNAGFTTWQEKRAETAMTAIKHYMPQQAKVVRDGHVTQVSVVDIVPGDLLVLEEGDRVPADARLIEASDLWTNNVPLTGESSPQSRTAFPSEDAPEGSYLNSRNCVFMSTSVVQGEGKAVVFATGMHTKFGEMAGLTIETQADTSPLQKKIHQMAKYFFVIALVIGGAFFLVAYYVLKVHLVSAIFFFIGVMVSCVPEGLQVTVSTVLAFSVLAMAKRHVLIKRLAAVQALGSVTTICTDKTGTITKGEMTTEQVYVNDDEIDITGTGYEIRGTFLEHGMPVHQGENQELDLIMELVARCNFARQTYDAIERKWTIMGDPTDAALLVASLKFGIDLGYLEDKYPFISKIPFTSARKRMVTVHRMEHGAIVFVKGAPFPVFDLCRTIQQNGTTNEFTPETRRAIENQYQSLAEQGLRILGCAFKDISEDDAFDGRDLEKDLTFLGLVAMLDPPREEVRDAVNEAKNAKVNVVIISGDAGPTTLSIAKQVGIVNHDVDIIRGADLMDMSNQAIVENIKEGNVLFARVAPEQKLRIVTALKQAGEIVAVTGDGANDGPSLKAADIGVAMGRSGTDLAREAADMILLDDSFSSIVHAVEAGRVIYENIRKFITYVFAHNWAELIPYVLYVLLNIPLPLLVIQVLSIDLFIDIVPSIALSQEPAEPGILERGPRGVKEAIFNVPTLSRSIFLGLVVTAGALGGCFMVWIAGGWTGSPNLATLNPALYYKGTTMTFAGIVIAQAGDMIACRTTKTSVFSRKLKFNKYIPVGIMYQVTIVCLLSYVPGTVDIFGTVPLGIGNWLYLASLPFVVIGAEELRKAFARSLDRQKHL
jgi:magnesium-transporting ATPase (P-type)